jgi:Flp pilus assembly protein TadG
MTLLTGGARSCGKLKKCPRWFARFPFPQAALVAVQLYRDQRAVVALEYAIVGPVFLLFLFAAFGVGLVGFYQLALDDAVREAGRQVQIDGPAAASKSNFVSAVCQTFGYLASDCTASLTYNVQASTPSAGFAGLSQATLSSSGKFSNAFFATGTPYAAGVNVLVQVSYPLPFLLPYIGALVTTTGTNSVVSTTTVRVEPFG